MKTLLDINEDLKRYLVEDCDRTNTDQNKQFCEIVCAEPFNHQWIFKFDNSYGASVIKHWGSYRV